MSPTRGDMGVMRGLRFLIAVSGEWLRGILWGAFRGLQHALGLVQDESWAGGTHNKGKCLA